MNIIKPGLFSNRWIKLLGLIVSVLGVAFLVWRVSKIDLQSLFRTLGGMTFISMFIGSFLALAALFLLPLSWKFMVSSISIKRTPFLTATAVYLISNMGKYLPSNIAHLLLRNAFITDLYVSHVELAMASGMELIVFAATAAGFGALLLFISGNLNENLRNYSIAILGKAVLFAIAASIAAACLFLIFKKKKAKENHPDAVKTTMPRLAGGIMKASLLYVVFFFIFGGFLYHILMSTGNTTFSFSDYLFVSGALSLSWLAGFIIPGVPAGIGVREATLVVILNSAYQEQFILAGGIILRIVCTIADLAGFGLGALFRLIAKKRKNGASQG